MPFSPYLTGFTRYVVAERIAKPDVASTCSRMANALVGWCSGTPTELVFRVEFG